MMDIHLWGNSLRDMLGVMESKPEYDKRLIGYAFLPMEEVDRSDYESLLKRNLPEVAPGRNKPLHGIKVLTSTGVMCAAIRTLARLDYGHVILYIKALIVDAPYRNHGIGSALLGLLDRVAPLETELIAGTCSDEKAAFYQRNGFVVEDSGKSLPLKDAMILVPADSSFPRWFHRRPFAG
ncbi:GNAT family N-acetyltransferase [Bifidobacterium sp. SO1]|uniref:GNAT family N-acetyltransferase n=1 Tax=Bifidobacterium sp. SO1 TaxID=2809029 RepID=UPI001BDD77D7|nr:GNAT family N-acetyltransferase [Bifidobacterium sp. SO1]MBT1162938.1 GNAT family N-acetyltransferase [Bifidobacterium sp. SO1]